MTQQEKNKITVNRFNKEYIEGGNYKVFEDIISHQFINHTAPQGVPKGPEGVKYFFENFLKPSFHELKVVIHDQLAEGDKVTTRKSFHAVHRGEFMGIPPTGKPVVIDVIDIITLKDDQFTDHWAVVDMGNVIQQIKN